VLGNSDGLLSSEDLKSEEECSLYWKRTLIPHSCQGATPPVVNEFVRIQDLVAL
jgi:hypothetical protein